jgi:hypothetical protein
LEDDKKEKILRIIEKPRETKDFVLTMNRLWDFISVPCFLFSLSDARRRTYQSTTIHHTVVTQQPP